MKQLHLDQSENINFCSYNHIIKGTLPFVKHINHEPFISFFFPETKRLCTCPFFLKQFLQHGPLAMCFFPGWSTWQLSALQIKFFVPSLLSNIKHRTFIHTDGTQTYMNWTWEQIGAPDIKQDTKGTEYYFCYKVQREQSMALLKFSLLLGTFSSLMMQVFVCLFVCFVLFFNCGNPPYY
jgi:hypothetical protein